MGYCFTTCLESENPLLWGFAFFPVAGILSRKWCLVSFQKWFNGRTSIHMMGHTQYLLSYNFLNQLLEPECMTLRCLDVWLTLVNCRIVMNRNLAHHHVEHFFYSTRYDFNIWSFRPASPRGVFSHKQQWGASPNCFCPSISGTV